ncbi:hypothetical protein AMTRI_Chr13g123210 [Amborella trichopoda]
MQKEEGVQCLDAGTPFDQTDDDGRVKRTGTLLTASAHIVTAVIGSGVLSLSWAIAQLGWIFGVFVLLIFSLIILYTSFFLADCYRYPDPVNGKRNYNYKAAVSAHLGGLKTKICASTQYVFLVGNCLGYAVTASLSMAAVERSNCFHKNGHAAECVASTNKYLVIYGCIQIVLSQIPNFHKLWGLSIVAAIMSFCYSSIGVGLSIAKIAGEGASKTTCLTGVRVGIDITAGEKFWRVCQALGNIAFASAFTAVLLEIQDTLKGPPPAENKVMKKATTISTIITTVFYLLCGCLGYAAFGSKAPGNMLTGFGYYEPFWLTDFANVCVAVHLFGSFQVFAQPLYAVMERVCSRRWPSNPFISNEWTISTLGLCSYSFNFFRITSRTLYVVVLTLIAMIFPFFNDLVGLIGSIAFWPLTVYFPVEMYIHRKKVQRASTEWCWLQILNLICLLVSVAAAVGSFQGLATSLRTYKPFKTF